MFTNITVRGPFCTKGGLLLSTQITRQRRSRPDDRMASKLQWDQPLVSIVGLRLAFAESVLTIIHDGDKMAFQISNTIATKNTIIRFKASRVPPTQMAADAELCVEHRGKYYNCSLTSSNLRSPCSNSTYSSMLIHEKLQCTWNRQYAILLTPQR